MRARVRRVLIAEGAGLRVHTVDAGTMRLDGGSMFGVVPKPLWEKHIPADDRNRIPIAMRCLLIESANGLVLVDTGVGNKENNKAQEIYGIENGGDPTRLESSLRAMGFEPTDIDLVVSTHLHFDHAGGHLVEDGGEVRPSFPNATYLIHRGEWLAAQTDNLRILGSYNLEHFRPLESFGVLEFIDWNHEIMPGVRTAGMPGHTEHHQGVLVELGSETICYPCDLVPTAAHTRLTWIMAFDLEPMVTLEQKERWLTEAAERGWLLVFAHDPTIAAARARSSRRGVGCELENPLIDRDRCLPETKEEDQ